MNIIPKFINVNHEKGRYGNKPLFVVIHIVGLPGVTAESAFGKASNEREGDGLGYFSNPNSEVSSHYCIKKDGTIWQFVRETDTAWANASIGRNLPTAGIARMYYQKGVSLNQISISIENEGSEYAYIPDAQYKANADLVRAICVRWNIPIDRQHIIGHKEIRDTKTCPGGISVDRIVGLASQNPVQPTPTPQPIPQPTPQPTPSPNISVLQGLLEQLRILQQKLAELLRNRQIGDKANAPQLNWKDNLLFLILITITLIVILLGSLVLYSLWR